MTRDHNDQIVMNHCGRSCNYNTDVGNNNNSLNDCHDDGAYEYIEDDFRNTTNAKRSSIQLFTFDAAVRCNYSFPIPTYKAIYDSRDTLSSKYNSSSANNSTYDWNDRMLD